MFRAKHVMPFTSTWAKKLWLRVIVSETRRMNESLVSHDFNKSTIYQALFISSLDFHCSLSKMKFGYFLYPFFSVILLLIRVQRPTKITHINDIGLWSTVILCVLWTLIPTLIVILTFLEDEDQDLVSNNEKPSEAQVIRIGLDHFFFWNFFRKKCLTYKKMKLLRIPVMDWAYWGGFSSWCLLIDAISQ